MLREGFRFSAARLEPRLRYGGAYEKEIRGRVMDVRGCLR